MTTTCPTHRRLTQLLAGPLAIFLALGAGTVAQANEDAEAPTPGYHLVSFDDASGRQPHLALGHHFYFQTHNVPATKVKADDPARNVTYDGTAVAYEYQGLNPKAKYQLRMKFLSDHPDGPSFPTRVVQVKANGVALGGPITLPEDEVAVHTFTLALATYAAGKLTVRIERVEGRNAVVSRVEVWSNIDQPLGDIALPAVFASHMVLQRGRPIPVWGYAGPGQAVTVKLADDEVRTEADRGGRWEVRLPARKAGGPYTLAITGKRRLTLSDILVGDVWICSGQSNMEMPLRQDKFFAEEKQQADRPTVRLFKVPALWSAGPAKKMVGTWETCNAKNAAEFSGVGYYFGKELNEELGVPIGLVGASVGGTPIENWTPGPTGHWYNGMLHPMLPFAIRGGIWYQGESNIESASHYYQQMQNLIGGWRRVWGQGQFPVYFVQLAPYRHRDDASALPVIWEAQRASLNIPNTGMAVTTDVSDQLNLHPSNKRAVGHRLALWALAKTYGRKQLVYSGPLLSHYTINDAKITIHFHHVGGGLTTRDKQPIDWFEIAGKDQRFVKATATIVGDTVVVTSPKIKEPVAVRFAWDQIAEPNLVNRQGLPAAPFRTDDWSPTATR